MQSNVTFTTLCLIHGEIFHNFSKWSIPNTISIIPSLNITYDNTEKIYLHHSWLLLRLCVSGRSQVVMFQINSFHNVLSIQRPHVQFLKQAFWSHSIMLNKIDIGNIPVTTSNTEYKKTMTIIHIRNGELLRFLIISVN